MSQRGSAPRPASHHSSAKPSSPRDNKDSSVTVTDLPSPTHSSQPGALRHLLFRDEPTQNRDMLSAEQGNNTSHEAPEGDPGGGQNKYIDSVVGTGVSGSGGIPATESDTMGADRKQTAAAPLTPAATAAAAAAATAALPSHLDDRVAQPTLPRTFGVHNILNPSDSQAARSAVAAGTMAVEATSGGNLERDPVQSQPLRRTRPGSANSPPIGSAATTTTGHGTVHGHGHGHFSGHMGNVGRTHTFQGHGQPKSATGSPASNLAASISGSPSIGYMAPAAGGGIDRESPPSSGHSFPSFGTPRRILTPKSPRRTSLGRGAPSFGVPPAQPPPYGRGSVGPETPPVPPIPPALLHQSMSAPSIDPGPYPPPHATLASGVPRVSNPASTPSAVATPPRSFSQPFFPTGSGGPGAVHGGHGGSHSTATETQSTFSSAPGSREFNQGRAHVTFPPPPSQRQHTGGYGSSAPPGRALSTGGVGPTGGDGSWPVPAMAGSGGGLHAGSSVPVGGAPAGRSMSLSEGQQFITITPSVGEEIHVPVDVHQASKQADEKRLRNAGASARFRARKKEKDREVQMGMQRLETQNRDLQKRVQELEVQRDFYRNERNRLRHFISQNPGMRDVLESAPASPASTSFSGGSFAPEASPMTSGGGPQQTAQLPHPSQQQQQQQQLHQQHHQVHHHQLTPAAAPPLAHSQPPLYPPMSAAPVSSGPPSLVSIAAEALPSLERPARRRRTDSGPGPEFHMPSYTTSAPSSSVMSTSLPPLPHAPHAGFHSMSPSPLSGSPSNPRLPPLRMDTPGSAQGSSSVGGSMITGSSPTPEPIPGVSSLPPAQYPPGTSSSAYSRTYETAGWAADTPSPHPQHPQHPPHDHGYPR